MCAGAGSSDLAQIKETLEGLHEAILESRTMMLFFAMGRFTNREMSSDETRSPLYFAVKNNMTDLVTLLLGQPTVGVDMRGANGWTALMRAAHDGNVAIGRILVERGAGVTETNDEGDSPLHIAADKERVDFARWLLALPGMDVNQKGSSGGETAIMKAVKTRNMNMVRLLAEEGGADVNVQNDRAENALSTALITDNPAVIAYMYSRPDIVIGDSEKRQLLVHSAKYGNVSLARRVLEELGGATEVECSNRSGTALEVGAAHGQQEIVQLLLGHLVACPNENSVLHAAAARGDVSMIGLLLDSGKVGVNSRNTHNRLAIEVGVEANSTEVVALLVARNSSTKGTIKRTFSKEKNLLGRAVVKGNAEMVRLLIEQGGASVNSADGMGTPALYYAADLDWGNVVSVLLRQPDVNLRDKHLLSNREPIDQAVYKGSLWAMEAFLRWEVNTNRRLHFSSWARQTLKKKGNEEMLRLVRKYHPNI